jgi:hypothetical protein
MGRAGAFSAFRQGTIGGYPDTICSRNAPSLVGLAVSVIIRYPVLACLGSPIMQIQWVVWPSNTIAMVPVCRDMNTELQMVALGGVAGTRASR